MKSENAEITKKTSSKSLIKTLVIPNILILDLDNTIIGSSIYHSDYLELKEFLLNLAARKKIKMKVEDFNKLKNKSLKYDDILRPYFVEFINYCNKNIPNLEIFIYSAGTLDYVTKYIDYIEKNHNLKFNRPIFSRNQTLTESNAEKVEIDFKKSLNLIVSKIISKLSLKYNDLKKTGVQEIFDNYLMFIDNRPDVLVDNEENQLVCYDYNFKSLIEINKLIPDYLYNNKIINKFLHNYINEQKKDKIIYEYSENDNKYQYKEKYYAWLSNKYRVFQKELLKKTKDDFYSKLICALSKNKGTKYIFSRKNIAEYQKIYKKKSMKKNKIKMSKSTQNKKIIIKK